MVRRASKGSILYLSTALLGLMIVGLGCAFGAYYLFFSQKRLQNQSESTALEAAQVLNDHDYSGRLNHLERAAREHVYDARAMKNQTLQTDYQDLAPLADQVLNEAREGAVLLLEERKALVAAADSKLTAIRRNHPEIETIEVGNYRGQQSNVEVLSNIPELTQHDEQAGYLQKGRLFNLYKSGVNLRLPAPDDDLDFVFSPLPATVKGTIAPLRLTATSEFERTRNNPLLPVGSSMVRISTRRTIKANLPLAPQPEGTTVGSMVTACAPGAGPEP